MAPTAANLEEHRRMLIDEWLPAWQFEETHSIRIQATPERVFASIAEADLGGHWIIRALMALRTLPTRLGRHGRPAPPPQMTLASLAEAGFEVLAEDRPREIVLGVVGRFWQLRDNITAFEPREFTSLGSGTARAAWNFSVENTAEGVRLTTITRVHCGGEESRRSFSRYWMLIRPFSGGIRLLMLRAIRKHAES